MQKTIQRLTTILVILSFTFSLMSTAIAQGETKKITQKDMIYFLLTDRFYDGDKTNNKEVINGDLSQYQGGDFQGVIDKLDYIKNLGFTAIWISPVVKNSIGGYHGYWANDFYKTNENFGTMDKLKELVSKAHAKDIKVIFDLVVNHSGPGFSFLDNPKYQNWFHPRTDIDYNNQASIENGWIAGLPDFNTENPEVKKYLIDMSKWWIKETGIDGYRIDTVKHIPKEFWTEFSKEIKKDYPDFYLVGEVFNGDANFVSGYQEAGINGMLDFPAYYTLNDVFKGDKPATALGDIINLEGKALKNKNLNGTFIDNHDVPRFINQVYRLKNEKLKSALTFMMTYTGIPILYYGTEMAMDGGTDPDNRGMMDFKTKSPITDYVKKLTKIRKTNNALTQGNIEVLKSGESFLCYVRNYENNTVIVAFNTSEKKQKIDFKVPEKYIGKLKIIKDSITLKNTNIKDGKVSLDMVPMQASVFIINK